MRSPARLHGVWLTGVPTKAAPVQFPLGWGGRQQLAGFHHGFAVPDYGPGFQYDRILFET
jgi:hypothetical protein